VGDLIAYAPEHLVSGLAYLSGGDRADQWGNAAGRAGQSSPFGILAGNGG
jgi:hypothetical protein